MNRTYNIFYPKCQTFWLTALRVVIGWYFLYEGLAKVLTPNWTAYGYLMDSKGIFSSLFKSLAENPNLLSISDAINMYGLIIIGVLLTLGLFEKAGYIGAAILLLLYYLSHPPLMNANYILRPEGSYLWIDKNMVMLITVITLIFFPSGHRIGLDRLVFRKKLNKNGR